MARDDDFFILYVIHIYQLLSGLLFTSALSACVCVCVWKYDIYYNIIVRASVPIVHLSHACAREVKKELKHRKEYYCYYYYVELSAYAVTTV